MSGAAPVAPESRTVLGWLRILIRLAAMALLLIACLPPYYLWRLRGPRNPWPRIFLGGMARIAGVRVRQVGARSRKGEFLLANHVSWIDIPALGGATGTAFVGHDGLASPAVLRWLCSLNDTVLIARDNRASVARQVAQVREAIRDTGALTIFPEGTTSDGTGLLPFKSALLAALAPVPPEIVVQPVWLDYGPDAANIAWVGNEPGMRNFLRALARARPIGLTIHFLPPLSGGALADRKAIAEAARNAIREEMRGAAANAAQRVAL